MNDLDEAIGELIGVLAEPHRVFVPTVTTDGNKWCALYGENLQEGVCGFGDTPALAVKDFDSNWYKGPAALSGDKKSGL